MSVRTTRARATVVCVSRQCARSHRIRAANGWLDAHIVRPIAARNLLRRANESLANALSFRLTRYVSEGDEAAAASGSDDDDDAEEEEVVEEEDAAPGKYKADHARRERVSQLNTCKW